MTKITTPPHMAASSQNARLRRTLTGFAVISGSVGRAVCRVSRYGTRQYPQPSRVSFHSRMNSRTETTRHDSAAGLG